MPKFIKYAGQTIDEDDIQAVVEVLKSDHLSQGPKIEEFEKKMADFTGARFCVAVASGSAALHLAVKAVDPPDGAGGITSPITFVASVNALIHNRLKPDFADIEGRTYCLSPQTFERRIGVNSKVAIPVHFAGQPAEMPAIFDSAKRNGMFVIEDAAHALGSRFSDGTPVGSCRYCHMTTFSFQPLKTITTGEGGAITTNDQGIYEKLLQYRNHGIVKDGAQFKARKPEEHGPWYHEIQSLGFNYRMTDFQAALGISQLKKINRFIDRRREIVLSYNMAFSNLEWMTIPFERPNVLSAFHLYVVKIDFKRIRKSRTQVMEELKAKGISAQVHYIPLHCQPFYKDNYAFQEGDFPVAEAFYRGCLSLPLHFGLSDEDVERVIEGVRGLVS
jgi:UDP-4-amino-4,6-dideoxy-N-acetyl-beta-L-altrosamine transaminase